VIKDVLQGSSPYLGSLEGLDNVLINNLLELGIKCLFPGRLFSSGPTWLTCNFVTEVESKWCNQGVSLEKSCKVYAKCLEKRCRKTTETKLEVTSCVFFPGHSTNFYTPANFVEILGVCQRCLLMICRPWRHLTRSLVKSFGVFWEYGVEICLWLAVKSLCVCSDVCVRVVKSQPFTLGVGIWQGCIFSPLLSVVHMIRINSHSWVDESVTCGTAVSTICFLWRIWYCWHFLSMVSFNMHLSVFSAACDSAKMKISARRTEVLCLSRNPS